MKHINNQIFILIALQFMLSGCNNNELINNASLSNINWQLRPTKPEERVVNSIEVVYNIPELMLKEKSVEELLVFDTFQYGTNSKQEKLYLNKQNPNLWTIERRTDNGVAGSGVIYDVEIVQQKLGNIRKVSFIVKKERKYQEGVVLPFAVPGFDIKKYLANAHIRYEFDLNSQYDRKSIQDNFQRLLSKNSVGEYFFDTKLATYYNKIKFYHYRDGTKVAVKSVIKIVSESDTVDVSNIINDLKIKIQEIVNS